MDIGTAVSSNVYQPHIQTRYGKRSGDTLHNKHYQRMPVFTQRVVSIGPLTRGWTSLLNRYFVVSRSQTASSLHFHRLTSSMTFVTMLVKIRRQSFRIWIQHVPVEVAGEITMRTRTLRKCRSSRDPPFCTQHLDCQHCNITSCIVQPSWSVDTINSYITPLSHV